MRIGLISDTHIKVHKKSQKFLPHIIKAIDLFYDECERRNVDMVFMLGDLFHVKDTVATIAQHHALKAFRKIMKRWPTHMIPGNHDILSKADAQINLLSVFADSCHLYEEYGSFSKDGVRFHFIPYLPDDKLLDVVHSIELDTNEKNILCSHLGIRGFTLDNNHEDVYSNLDLNHIDIGWDRIFSGHYHSHQTRGNLTYISSPYESHFGDEGDHGFVFYDTEKDSIEFFENKISPKFITVDLNVKNMDFINTIENSFIKLVIKKNIDNNLLIRYREKLIKKNFDVVFDFNIAAIGSKIAIAKDWESFVNEKPEDILVSYIKESKHPEFTSQELMDYIGI